MQLRKNDTALEPEEEVWRDESKTWTWKTVTAPVCQREFSETEIGIFKPKQDDGYREKWIVWIRQNICVSLLGLYQVE